MEIELPGLPSPQVQRHSGTANPQEGQSSTVANPSQPAAPATDSVTLTSTASAIQQASRQLESAPVVDQNAVNRIREEISTGSYEIDPMRVAEKMTQFEAQLGA